MTFAVTNTTLVNFEWYFTHWTLSHSCFTFCSECSSLKQEDREGIKRLQIGTNTTDSLPLFFGWSYWVFLFVFIDHIQTTHKNTHFISVFLKSSFSWANICCHSASGFHIRKITFSGLWNKLTKVWLWSSVVFHVLNI